MTVRTEESQSTPDHGRPRPAPSAGPTAVGSTPADSLVEEDLLVEDVSIDGMCGVY